MSRLFDDLAAQVAEEEALTPQIIDIDRFDVDIRMRINGEQANFKNSDACARLVAGIAQEMDKYLSGREKARDIKEFTSQISPRKDYVKGQ